MSKELKTTQSNNAIQFVQGISSKNLDNVAITPGTVYFFDDGSIIWDHETNGENKRSTMSGQTFSKTLTNGTITIQNGTVQGDWGSPMLTIPRSGSLTEYYDDVDGNQDNIWQNGKSHWISLITLNKDGNGNNHMEIPDGVYELQLHLNASRVAGSDALRGTNVIYSGTFSKISGNVNRAADEILLHRAGAQGLIPPAHMYARLYGREKGNIIIPLQLQLASSHQLDIYSITIILRRITSINVS